MNVRNCRKCGKLFNYTGRGPICPVCLEESEKQFQTVKEYIRENKGAEIHAVAEACEVEVSQIRQWVREERLTFADDSPIGLNCEHCGAVIKTGRYCEKCKKEMASEMESVTKSMAPRYEPPKKEVHDSAKMRFL